MIVRGDDGKGDVLGKQVCLPLETCWIRRQIRRRIIMTSHCEYVESILTSGSQHPLWQFVLIVGDQREGIEYCTDRRGQTEP